MAKLSHSRLFFPLCAMAGVLIGLVLPLPEKSPPIAEEVAGIRAELAAIRQLLEERQP